MNTSHHIALPCLVAALVLLPVRAESHAHDGENNHAVPRATPHLEHHAPAAGQVAAAQEHSLAPFDHLCAHSWDFELAGYADNNAMQKWVENGLRHVHFDHAPTSESVSKLCWVEGARLQAAGQREQARAWLALSREDEAMATLACMEYEEGNVDAALRMTEELMRMEEEQGISIPVSTVLSLPMLRYAAGLISREELEKAAAEHAQGAGAWVHDYVDIPWILQNVIRTPEDARHIRARLETAADAGSPEAEVALISLAEKRIMLVGQRPGWYQRLEALAPTYERAARLRERVEMLRWVLNDCLPSLMPAPNR